MAERVDVLICGSGSAGLCAATWLATYGVRCRILEKRDGPMKIGQADGVQCRTVEIFESFGLADELLREAYHVLEVDFWADDGAGSIRRTGRTADTQPGLSHQPHVILNQARINGLLLEKMQALNSQGIDYGYEVDDVKVDTDAAADADAYPVTVTAKKHGRTETFRAKYVLACDGAHSAVRRALGYHMVGDTTDAVWGVMDTIPRTSFPDIRKKVAIRSSSGNLLIIPREGERLTRTYIELPPGTQAKDVRLEELQEAAKRIFSPFQIEFIETVWWSAYAIGQRYADHFHKDYRVFLAGDACHTHSPKAGQGMNVSLQDGYNIGWKLGSILTGLARPSILETYVLERQKVAIDLIEFDRYFARLFSSGVGTHTKATPEEFQQGFIQAGKFTAGLTSKYEPSMITFSKTSQELASNVVVGMRLPSAQVVRYCDSKPLQLASSLNSDGRWRIMTFAGNLEDPANAAILDKIGRYFSSKDSPIQRFTPRHADVDSLIELILVAHGDRHAVEFHQIPQCFYPVTGKHEVRDIHKIYFDDASYNKGHGHAYDFLGVDPNTGAIIIVRPDQYVAGILGLDQYKEIGAFFEGFLIPLTFDQASHSKL